MGYSILRTLSVGYDDGSNQSFFDDGLDGWGHREHFTKPAGWDSRDEPWLEGLGGGEGLVEDEDLDEDEGLDDDDLDDLEDDDLDDDDLDDLDEEDGDYREDTDYDVYTDFDGEDDEWD
jgi:hypothetical protein